MAEAARNESRGEHIRKPTTLLDMAALFKSHRAAERDIVQAASAVGILWQLGPLVWTFERGESWSLLFRTAVVTLLVEWCYWIYDEMMTSLWSRLACVCGRMFVNQRAQFSLGNIVVETSGEKLSKMRTSADSMYRANDAMTRQCSRESPEEREIGNINVLHVH